MATLRVKHESVYPGNSQSFYPAPVPPDKALIQSLESCLLPSKPPKLKNKQTNKPYAVKGGVLAPGPLDEMNEKVKMG